MGIYSDITLYCDVCGTEGYESTRAGDSRKNARKDGWKRKKIEGELKDICPECLATELIL